MLLLVLAATVDGRGAERRAEAEVWTQVRQAPAAQVLTASSW
jgi:hypothetical protein